MHICSIITMQMRAKCYVMSEASESQVSCDGDGAL